MAMRVRARLRRLIINPVMMVVIAILLANEVSRVAQHDRPARQSHAGAWVARQLNMPRLAGAAHRSSGQVFIVRESDGLVVIDPDRESWDRLTRLLTERPEDVLEVQYTARQREHGFWRPTRREVRLTMATMDFGGTFTEQERAAAHGAAAGIVASDVRVAGAGQWREAELVERSILWRGVALNLYALLLLGGFVYSLQWVGRVPAWCRAVRQRRAAARGVCVRCGYTLRGLEEPVCPECGHRR